MKYITYVSIVLMLFSCHKLKNKGKELAVETKQQVEEKSEEMVDRIVPHFDAYNPDTKFNKERFKEFLQVELTPDVKNIYCFGDAMGIDADYQFSFNCNLRTAERIIQKHGMKADKESMDFAVGLQSDFPWWEKEKIKKLELYSWHDDNQYYKNFWYDPKEERAYYFEFDM